MSRIFASRLALPLYLLLLLAIIQISPRILTSSIHWYAAYLVFALYIVGWTLPHNSYELFTKRNYVQNELDWLIDEVGEGVSKRDLVVDHKSTVWTLARKTAIRPYQFFENMKWVEHQMRTDFYDNIYFIERLEYQVQGNKIELQEVNYPKESLQLELLLERSFRPFSVVRISRVVAVRPSEVPDSFIHREGYTGHVADYTFNGL